LNLTSRTSVRPRKDTIYPTGDEVCGSGRNGYSDPGHMAVTACCSLYNQQFLYARLLEGTFCDKEHCWWR
ncbi:hypothetical protein GBAR_LOCUS13395, partial [Geodia barretti]